MEQKKYGQTAVRVVELQARHLLRGKGCGSMWVQILRWLPTPFPWLSFVRSAIRDTSDLSAGGHRVQGRSNRVDSVTICMQHQTQSRFYKAGNSSG